LIEVADQPPELLIVRLLLVQEGVGLAELLPEVLLVEERHGGLAGRAWPARRLLIPHIEQPGYTRVGS
jgi:hypothetical protein